MQRFVKGNYLKSKKGISLVELLCAVLIIAIVVGATATGLAIANQSITMGAEKDKASSLVEEYCDVIMTYVENTPSNDPAAEATGEQASKNYLFDDTDWYKLMDTNIGYIKGDCSLTDDNFMQIEDETKLTENAQKGRVLFFIAKDGEDNANFEKNGTKYVTYKVTVYQYYTDVNSVHCSGTVSVPELAP